MLNETNSPGTGKTSLKSEATNDFESLLKEIPQIGQKVHSKALLSHATANLSYSKRSIKDLPLLNDKKSASAMIISAGPSVHRKKSILRVLESGYKGTVIVVDGSYVACLKAGLVPDFIVTLDPHPTRMVRWFGDPNFEKNSENDDYFVRQDLDIDFRQNSIRQNAAYIDLVNKMGFQTKAIVCSSAPANVVQRIQEAKFEAYWWNPLVDDPTEPGSLTRQIYALNRLPCFNTGGNVGPAAWVFASTVLKCPKVALVGMDFGYYNDTPLKHTQTYYELIDRIGTEEGIEKYFLQYTYPVSGEKFYTDVIYAWYRKNFFELLEKSSTTTFNCTEGGTLFGEGLKCVPLDAYFQLTR